MTMRESTRTHAWRGVAESSDCAATPPERAGDRAVDLSGASTIPGPSNGRAAGARILVILTETFSNGGIQRFNRTLIAACETLGAQCDVYSLNDDANAVHTVKLKPTTHVRTFHRRKARFASAVGAALATGRYDTALIGHVNLLELVLASVALRFARLHLTMIAHGAEVWHGLSGVRRRGLSKVDRILCVSQYTRDVMLAQAPELDPNRFSIFPNALSSIWTERADATGRLALPEGIPPRFLLGVARLDRVDRTKGILSTIEALPMVRDQSLGYVVAGSGNDMKLLRDVAARFGVKDRVILLGPVSDSLLISLYRQCVAFVLPSGQEGFGIVFIEAMYFGAPVIGAREKGAVDALDKGATGLMVDYGDIAAIARRIDEVTDDASVGGQLTAVARATVTGDGPFTFAAFTRRCAHWIDEAVRAARAGAVESD
jgi:glycosyltransferase involved in cell wall biosynthesis